MRRTAPYPRRRKCRLLRARRRGELYRDAAILGASLRGLVAGDRVLFAEPFSRQDARRYVVRLQVILHGARSAFGELLVVFRLADGIRVSADAHLRAMALLNGGRDSVENRDRL